MRYWIETDDTIGPQIEDIVRADIEATPIVRVFTECPPFVLGEVVAFFVGPGAEENAKVFIKARAGRPQA